MSGKTIDPMKEFLRRSAADTLLARQKLLESLPPEQRRIMEKRFHEAEGARHQDARPE